MIKDITLGQYFPGNSAIHRLDPRTKLLGMIAYIVIVFLVTKTPVFIIPALFAAICIYLARVPFGYVIRSLKPIRFLLVFMFIVNLFMVRTGKTVIAFWIISITDEAIKQSVYITLRLVLLLVGTSLMTLTTTPIALTDGLERLLMPLSKIHFPAHELAMMKPIAMASRCYHGGEGRTRMNVLKIGRGDGVAAAAFAVLTALTIAAQKLIP